MNARDKLIEIYLDYYNNYLTIERYAECNGLKYVDAVTLIFMARDVANSEHPDR